MCIFCKMREAGATEEVLTMAGELAKLSLAYAEKLIKLELAGFRLSDEERKQIEQIKNLFKGEDDEVTPEGVPGEVWTSAPPQLRAIIRALSQTAEACKLCRFPI